MTVHYRWVALLSGAIVFLMSAAAFLAPDPWRTISALLAGGAASLCASVVVQITASEDQSRLLRDLGLKVDGFRRLPDEFRRIRWIAYATTAPDDDDNKCAWRVREISKISEVGDAFVIYDIPSKTPIGEDAHYRCSFVGLPGRAVAIVSSGDEPASVLIFDVPVTAAAIYFGAAYITDWYARRDLTLAFVGLGTPPDPAVWSNQIQKGFVEWKASVRCDAERLLNEFGTKTPR